MKEFHRSGGEPGVCWEDGLASEGVLAVICVAQVESAVPLARALIAGGITVVELAWRTPATVEVLRVLRKEVPELKVGIGTVWNKEQLETVCAEGAAFAVSPGFCAKLVEHAHRLNFPYAPGVVTPSEIQQAVALGCRLLKLFPAESSGGLAYLRSIHAPFAHLGVRFLVLGGLNEENAQEYLKEPAVSLLGGSWIAPAPLIAAGAWEEIRLRAARARQLVDQTRRR